MPNFLNLKSKPIHLFLWVASSLSMVCHQMAFAVLFFSEGFCLDIQTYCVHFFSLATFVTDILEQIPDQVQDLSSDLSAENILHEFDAGCPITEPDLKSSYMIGRPKSNSWSKFQVNCHLARLVLCTNSILICTVKENSLLYINPNYQVNIP